MAEVTTGFRSFLSYPSIYNAWQKIVGVPASRKVWVEEFIQPRPGQRILDIGCGTAWILDYFRDMDIQYTGFDGNEKYIKQTQKRWKHKPSFRFEAGRIHELIDRFAESSFDTLMVFG